MIPKELRDEFIAFWEQNWAIALIITMCVGTALFSLLYLPKDNPIEQAAEKVIEEETGVKLDFSP